MADSFMIRFLLHGKLCYANVHVYTTTPVEYHVHIVNAQLYPGVPEKIVLVDGHEGLTPRELSAAMAMEVKSMIEEIQKKNEGNKQ